MRQIGTLNEEKQAHLFSNYLLSLSIETQVEEDDQNWIVWVRDEDQLDESKQLLLEFRDDPDNVNYQNAANAAITRKREQQRQAAQQSKRQVDVGKNVWSQPTARRSPLTLVLAIACIAVALLTSFGEYAHRPMMRSLMLADPVHDLQPTDASSSATNKTWQDIQGGQIWRLVTPIFVHFNPAHIAFNMIFLFSLGGMIESRRSTAILGLVVLASAIGGNVGQAFVTGPNFGGMSGVVYGLLGFIWIRMYVAPGEGLAIAKDNIIIMMIWMVLGFMGVLKAAFGADIANTAHLCGLLAGILVAIALPVGLAKEQQPVA